MKGNKPQGFTLIELIVVLVIVGLVSGLVMPRMFGALTHVSLRSGARDVVTILRQARDIAGHKNSYIKVSFGLEQGVVSMLSYQAVEEPEASWQAPEMAWVEIGSLVLPDDVRVETVTLGDDIVNQEEASFFFYSSGHTREGMELTLVNAKGRSAVVKVDAITGNAYIEESEL